MCDAYAYDADSCGGGGCGDLSENSYDGDDDRSCGGGD